jgi:hypothetical protein
VANTELIIECSESIIDSISYPYTNPFQINLYKDVCEPNGYNLNKVIHKNNPYIHEKRVTYKNRILFNTIFTPESTYEDKRTNKPIYRKASATSNHSGLKSYNESIDTIRKEAHDHKLNYLKDKRDFGIIDLSISSMDIAWDMKFKKEQFQSISNFFIVHDTKLTTLNDPFNLYYDIQKRKPSGFYNEPLYKKDGKIFNTQTRAYIYIKDWKENLEDDEYIIIRFELKLSKLKNKSKNSYELIEYIEKQLKPYKLFYFEDIDICNELKEQYKDRIPKENHNITKKLLSTIQSTSSKEIELKLSDSIKNHIIDTLTKKEKPLNEYSKINQIIKKLPRGRKRKPIKHSIAVIEILFNKKENYPTLKIEIYQIPKGDTQTISSPAKNMFYNCKRGIKPLSINPLLLKAFPPMGTDPPIINLYLNPY